jgi:hypothetical protein
VSVKPQPNKKPLLLSKQRLSLQLGGESGRATHPRRFANEINRLAPASQKSYEGKRLTMTRSKRSVGFTVLRPQGFDVEHSPVPSRAGGRVEQTRPSREVPEMSQELYDVFAYINADDNFNGCPAEENKDNVR